MKTRIIIIAILLGFAGLVIAATLTIDIPANDVPRVSEAFGSIYNLGHPANMTEVSAATRQWIIQSTQDYERRKNMAQFTPTPLEMQPTPSPTPGLRAEPSATPKKK